jgi:ABC-type multidrug transport system fused ATPase/permease subunit
MFSISIVMDAGSVVENDSPLNLFDMEGGIFRGMCEGSSISREHILDAIPRYR